MGFKVKFKNLERGASNAGSSGYGDGDEDDGGATPPTPPRLTLAQPPSGDVSALPTSPPPVQPPGSPRPPADKDADEGLDNEDRQEVADDEDEVPDDEKIYNPLFMSGQRENLPHDILRHDSVPLSKDEYFSLRENWKQLLDGKRTYLRPPREHRVLSDVFQCPADTPKKASGRQKRLARLVKKHSEIVQKKIKILSQHYGHFRRTRGDGSCFYRAFLFSYLENLGQMQDSQAEVNRLMEHLAISRDNFCRLNWDKAYFLNPEAYFSSVASEFGHLVNSVANGLSSHELYNRSIQEIMPLRIISLLRLLTETEIRSREDDYKSHLPEEMDALTYCRKALRPLDVEASGLPIRL